jgi:hypothetical protein
MVEGNPRTETVESLQAGLLEGKLRADRLEGMLRRILHKVAPGRDVHLLVLDAGEGKCLVAVRHRHHLIQVNFWKDLVDMALAESDPYIEEVLARILLGVLEN